METLYYKICIIGDSNVGKSSIAEQYINSKFDPCKPTTIGAAYFSKKIKYKNSNIHLQIWDTAGQERYRSIIPLYYRNAAAVILVLDSSNYKSFSNANYWIKFVKEHIPNVPIFISINKCDLPSMLPDNFIYSIIESYPTIKHKFVSAKTNDGIENLFKEIVETIYKDPSLPVTNVNPITLKKDSKPRNLFHICSIL